MSFPGQHEHLHSPELKTRGRANGFPADLRRVKVAAIEKTIQFLEFATKQPKLRSIDALLPTPK